MGLAKSANRRQYVLRNLVLWYGLLLIVLIFVSSTVMLYQKERVQRTELLFWRNDISRVSCSLLNISSTCSLFLSKNLPITIMSSSYTRHIFHEQSLIRSLMQLKNIVSLTAMINQKQRAQRTELLFWRNNISWVSCSFWNTSPNCSLFLSKNSPITIMSDSSTRYIFHKKPLTRPLMQFKDPLSPGKELSLGFNRL